MRLLTSKRLSDTGATGVLVKQEGSLCNSVDSFRWRWQSRTKKYFGDSRATYVIVVDPLRRLIRKLAVDPPKERSA